MKNVANDDPEALRHRALAHPVRLRLLRVLEEAGPLDVHALAAQVAEPDRVVRRHLGLLVRAGLVSAAAAEGGRPGRPRLRYRATAAEDADRVGYPLLADMLAGSLGRLDDAAAVEAEGREWGRRLVERPPAPVPVEARDATARLASMLDRLGFAPQTSETESGVRVDIRRCPFLDTAKVYPGVVCSLHLGLMQGALAELRAPLEAERLDPLVEPTLCIGHLRRDT